VRLEAGDELPRVAAQVRLGPRARLGGGSNGAQVTEGLSWEVELAHARGEA
jgi:hypothetical protein